MASSLIISGAEAQLLEELSVLRSEKANWRVAILRGSQMELSHRRILRGRESHITLRALLTASNITGYCCADDDIIFLFRSSIKRSWAILQQAAHEMLPHLDPSNIDFNTLFSFYDLGLAYDEFVQIVRDKLARPVLELVTPPEILANYYWDKRIFRRAQEERATRGHKLAAVVEDDFTARQLARDILRPHYGVLSATNGHEALDLYNSHAPDLMFLDINIPHIDGLKVLTTIMQADKEAAVVMFSAHSERDILQKALALGARGFVTKPFNADTLLQYARKAVA